MYPKPTCRLCLVYIYSVMIPHILFEVAEEHAKGKQVYSKITCSISVCIITLACFYFITEVIECQCTQGTLSCDCMECCY